MPDVTFTEASRAAAKPGERARCLTLVLECERPQAPPLRLRLDGPLEVGRGERSTAGGLRVPDRWMSGRHATITPVLDHAVVEDLGSKNGTLVNGERVTRAELEDGDLVELGHTFFLYRECVAAPAAVAEPERAVPGLPTLCPGLGADLARLARVAPSTLPVIIRGETGTGKEVAARAVHALSARRGAFVAVNCGALPETLVEAELFGARKGSYSGAGEDRPGLVRTADGGTLFLDEIGDLPLLSQAALLRVLQEREVVPVGGTRPLPVDLRVVSATHRDLDRLVEAGTFREDLLARLGGFTLRLPPLAERREDLGLLAGAILERLAPGRSTTLTAEAARALIGYEWPQNVRELERALGAALVLSKDGTIELGNLPDPIRSPVTAPSPGGKADPKDDALEAQLRDLLVEHKGNVSQIAREMGKARMQIQRWLKRFAIDPASYRR